MKTCIRNSNPYRGAIRCGVYLIRKSALISGSVKRRDAVVIGGTIVYTVVRPGNHGVR
ncbi:uncharacterized protein METZ01_LOCUS516879 [marine metagenome]|uniref:Uncharacterized protein n=1 Tax=marine metagenome TaxID=408172 RepID=A0A383F6M8_9ZZZZ